MTFRRKLISMAFLVLLPNLMFAQNRRSAVSVNGSDSNNCTVPAPCRTFGAAIAVTDPGGEIIALDSGGFGPFTIDVGVTIQPVPGAYAAIAPTIGSAITVSAPSTAHVVIRGLTLTGLGAADGIDFVTGNTLYVDNVTISGFSSNGVDFIFASTATLVVRDSVVNDSGFGIEVETSSGTATAYIERTLLTNNTNGLRADARSKVTVRDSAAVKNSFGFVSNCPTGTACELNIENSAAVGNTTTGMTAGSTGGASTIRVSNCTITNNATGLSFATGQSLLTRNNNTVEGNTTDGSFSGPYTAK